MLWTMVFCVKGIIVYHVVCKPLNKEISKNSVFFIKMWDRDYIFEVILIKNLEFGPYDEKKSYQVILTLFGHFYLKSIDAVLNYFLKHYFRFTLPYKKTSCMPLES